MEDNLYYQYVERLAICLVDANLDESRAMHLASKDVAETMRADGINSQQIFIIGKKLEARARKENIIK